MGATSVTGVSGYGMSHGMYKPENQCGGCGCGCTGKKCHEERRPEKKTGCYTRVRSNGSISYKSGGGINVRGC